MATKRKRANSSAAEGTDTASPRITRSSVHDSGRIKPNNPNSGNTENTPLSKKAKTAKSVSAKGKRKTNGVSANSNVRPSIVARHEHGGESSADTSTDPKIEVGPSGQDSGSFSAEPYTPKRALALFSTYADPDEPESIGPEGFEKLCADADIPLESVLPLIFLWQLDAKEVGKFTKDEWIKSTADLEISSLPPLAQALRDLEDLLILNKDPIQHSHLSVSASTKKRGTAKAQAHSDPYNRAHRYHSYAENRKGSFSKFYTFCFTLVKPPQARNIDMETATVFWPLLLGPRYPIISDIVEFINEKVSYKAANKDLWNMVLEFCQTVNPTLDDYEADGAWPSLLDEFVIWKQGKMVEGHSGTAHPS